MAKGMGKPLISLCMIMKDEEDNLPRALNSVAKLVDEMIIVDTGSQDASVEIAKSFGARVYFMPWQGDFSGPRNLAMDKARGKWILIFDADEEFCQEDVDKTRELARGSSAEGIIFTTVNFIGTEAGVNRDINLNIRLVRNRKEYRYREKVHESLSGVFEKTVVQRSDINIFHYGYMDQELAKKNKVKRNLQLLLDKFTSEEVSNFDYYNLGVEYVRGSQWEKAAECFEHALKDLNPNLLWGSALRRAYLLSLANLGRYQDGLMAADEALKIYPNYADLIYLKGIMHSGINQYPEAVGCFHQCLVLEGMVPIDYSHDAGVCSYKAHFALGKSYEAMGKLPKAIEHYRQGIALNPNAMDILGSLLAAVFLKDGQEGLDQAAKEYSLDYGRLLVIIEMLANLGQKDLACSYLDKAREYGSETDQETYLRALVYSKFLEWETCLEEIAKIPPGSKYFKQANLLGVASYWYKGEAEKAREVMESSGFVSDDYRSLAKTFLQQARGALVLGKQAWPETGIFNDYENLVNKCESLLG